MESRFKNIVPKQNFGTKTVSCLFILLCLLGCVFQVYKVSDLYFRYQATTEIDIEIPEIVSGKAISVCSRFVEHLDYERIARDSKSRSSWHYSNQVHWIRKYQHELTIKEIFKYTPEVNTTLSRIIFRENQSYVHKEYSGHEIYDHFEVRKYLYLEYICYKFASRKTIDISYSSLSVTPVFSGQVYELTFNTTLESAEMLKVVINSMRSHQYRSIQVIPVLRRNYNIKTKTAQYNVFSSFVTTFDVFNLPPPYETNCFNYKDIGFQIDTHCIQECVKKKVVKRFNKIPFSAIIDKPIDMKMISYTDISDARTSKILFDIENECSNEICNRPSCHASLAMTTTKEIEGLEFVIRRIIPSGPSFHVRMTPALNLIEFLTYLLSTVSTWTGISIISLNPWKFLSKRKRKNKIHDQRISSFTIYSITFSS